MIAATGAPAREADMATMDIGELETRAGELVRRVRDRETIDVTDGGTVVARVVPAAPAPSEQQSAEQPADPDVKRDAMLAWLRDMEPLIAELAIDWPKGVSAQDVIDDVRRERW